MSLKSLPWARPLRAPFEEVFISLLDGTVYRWKPLSHRQAATRLCIPADYANDKLRCWNQKRNDVYPSGFDQYGNPWKLEKLDGKDNPYFRLGQTELNTGTSVKLHIASNYQVHTPISSGWARLFCGWSHDKANNKYSWEFYVDNDLEETDPTVLQDDNWTADWQIGHNGSGSYDWTFSNDAAEKVKGANSGKLERGAGTHASCSIWKTLSPHQNWSSREFIPFYVHGDNSGETVFLQILMPDWSNFITYSITVNWSGWKRLVLPLNDPTSSTGSPDYSDVASINLEQVSQTLIRFDRMLVDKAQVVKVEAFIPDLLPDGYNIKLYSWDGSEWKTASAVDDEDGTPSYPAPSNQYYLNGVNVLDMFGPEWSNKWGIYLKGERGESKAGQTGSLGAGGGYGITYSSYHGCLKRSGLILKMPPDDGQDASDAGISQCKLKLEVYYADDGKTTYEFENGTNQYYGLQNMNDSWLACFDATTKAVEFLVLSKRPTGLEVRADENELIDRVDLTLAKGTRVFAGELVHGDLTRDTDADDVPDFLEDFIAPLVSKMFVKGGFP